MDFRNCLVVVGTKFEQLDSFDDWTRTGIRKPIPALTFPHYLIRLNTIGRFKLDI